MKANKLGRELQSYLGGMAVGMLFVAVVAWLTGDPLSKIAFLASIGFGVFVMRKLLGIYLVVFVLVLSLVVLVLDSEVATWQMFLIYVLLVLRLGYDIWIHLAKIPKDEYRERLEAKGSELASVLVFGLAGLMLVGLKKQIPEDFTFGLMIGAIAVMALSRIYAWWGLRR